MIRLRAAFLSLIVAVLSTVALLAQEVPEKVDVDIGIKDASAGPGFWGSPWVWVIGGAVFILLLVALLRSGGNKGD